MDTSGPSGNWRRRRSPTRHWIMGSYRVPSRRNCSRSATAWGRRTSIGYSANGSGGFHCLCDRRTGRPATTGPCRSGRWRVSLTQIYDRPLRGQELFEEVIRDNLDLGRPDRVQLIFGRRVTKRTPGYRRLAAGRSPPLGAGRTQALWPRSVHHYKEEFASYSPPFQVSRRRFSGIQEHPINYFWNSSDLFLMYYPIVYSDCQ